MPKISACVVIHNEGALLERCLASFHHIVDEIIVVHDGDCSDNSLEIAQKFGSRIFTRPHHGEAEIHRCFSYEQAQGDWILQMDADELLPEPTQKIIPQLITNNAVDAYFFRWAPTNGQQEIGRAFLQNTKMFLLRKSKMYMVGITHEFPKTFGVESQRPDINILHQPNYNNFSVAKLYHKWFKWDRIQAKQIISLPDAPTFGIDDLKTTREYQFYQRMINHPFRVAIKYAYDIWLKVLRDIKVHPSRPFDWQSWKIAILNSVNYAYLGWRVYRERQKVEAANRWWLHGETA